MHFSSCHAKDVSYRVNYDMGASVIVFGIFFAVVSC